MNSDAEAPRSIVITDTGPIHYLILIGQVDILPHLFSEVIIPADVLGELGHPNAPSAVRAWVGKVPRWATVASPLRSPEALGILTGTLGRGELAAMAIAKERTLPILMDDRKARDTAREYGLVTLGTLSLLEAADINGWLRFDHAVSLLQKAGFYVSQPVIEEIERRIPKRP